MQTVTTFLVHRVQDFVRSVQADEVHQRQRTHGKPTAQFHGRINIFTSGVALLVHGHRMVEIAKEQRVGDEPGPIPHHHRFLAQGSREVKNTLDHRF